MNNKHPDEVKERVRKLRAALPPTYIPTLCAFHPELRGNDKERHRIQNMIYGRSVAFDWLEKMEAVFVKKEAAL